MNFSKIINSRLTNLNLKASKYRTGEGASTGGPFLFKTGAYGDCYRCVLIDSISKGTIVFIKERLVGFTLN
jgi:hypothetical protein